MLKNFISSFIILTLIHFSLFAQVNFQVNDDAAYIGNNCYRLTNDTFFVKGTIWSNNKINLTTPFDFACKINFGGHKQGHGNGAITTGCGADGVVFALQQVSTSVGGAGYGIGYQGITPSLGVEFDTYKNSYDPGFDHIAILKNGEVDHNKSNTISGPIQASSMSTNIKDSLDHWVRVSWDPTSKDLKVYFDCQLRLTYNGDIISTIFQNNPNVFWGFTSATGMCSNYHSICFENFPEGVVASNTGPVCFRNQVQLYVQGSSYLQYSWTGPGGYTSNQQSPIITTLEPSGIGTYSVVVSDGNCPLYSATTEIRKKTGVKAIDSIPNVITPNADGINDIFKVEGFAQDFFIEIFNRWGIKMRESTDISNIWDGKYNSENVSNGTYFYIITYIDCNNEKKIQTGSLTVL